MAAMKSVIVSAMAIAGAQATGVTVTAATTRNHGNPMRKVVTMLQSISKKVENEGKQAEDLFDKFMCECNKQSAALEKQIENAGAKGAETAAALEAGKGQLEQLTADLAQAKTDRASAKEAIASATALREKEAKAFADMKAESEANIDSMGQAISALRAGTGGSFLQTNAAASLRHLVQKDQDMFSGDQRDTMEAFLQGGDSSEGTGEIIGMLEQLKETMSGDLAADTKTEEEAIQTFNDLVAAKTKEFNALQASIEEKMTRLGELGVANAELGNAGGDTGDALADDKKSLADLKESCAARAAEWEVEKKTRAEELVALADVIKMLNDDEALELFKKALPGAASSFMQVAVTESTLRARALSMVRASQKKHHKSTGLDFIALALHGKKVGFEKVIALIDKMALTLKADQKADEDKKAYCEAEFDSSDDQKKALERKVQDSQTAIEDAKETVATLIDEIAALKAGIKDLDGDVTLSTAQRQAENAVFKQLMVENNAAKELIGMAKNRLNKFYNPSQYKAPPKRELSEEDRIAVNMGGTAPPTPAPGGIAGTGISASFLQVDQKKAQAESSGVIAMMDLLSKDLENQITVGETEEKNAQEDYEKAMADAAAKRTADAKLLEEKESAKADTDDALQGHVDDKKSLGDELMGTNMYIMSLHADCDWLIKNFEQRKAARTDEIDAMMKAKDVLQGADYSLLQTKHTHSLRGGRA